MSDQLDWASSQRWLFQALTAPASEVDAHLLGRDAFSARSGLAVYQNAYWVRLIACLAETFWATHRALGEEAFSALALSYLQARPPQGPNLSTLGASFALHLRETCPEDAGDSAHTLIDLVHYEWSVDRVFDGPGIEGGGESSIEGIAQLGPDAWIAASLSPHPALRCLRLSSPADAYIATLRGLDAGAPPPALPPAEPRFLALTRRDYRVRVLVCEAEELALIERLAQGVSVGDSLQGLAGAVAPERVQAWFARWMTEGLFVGFECA